MKKETRLIVILILVMSLFQIMVQAETADIKVTLQSQTPSPVEPGQVVLVKFKIENLGKESVNDAIVRVLPIYPFSIYGNVGEVNIGKLRASNSGADAEVVQFKLKVDEDAVEEETEIELEVKVGNSGVSYKDDEFLIDIQTNDAILDITSINMEPSMIAPGKTAEISISVKNLADSLLKDIKFKLDFSNTDLPLAPYQSSSERVMDHLNTGFQNTLIFKVIADPDATPGLYKVPMNITYNDEKSNTVSIKDILAVTIGDVPKVRPFIKKSSVLQSNEEGTITLGIANAGTTDVKYVELFILPSDDFQLVSTSDYIYIGEIDSDDTESEDLEIFINKKVDKLLVPVRIKYLDANNNNFEQAFDLEMNLYSSSQLKKFGIIESSNTWIYLLIIVLVGGSYWFYRKKGYIPFMKNYFMKKKK